MRMHLMPSYLTTTTLLTCTLLTTFTISPCLGLTIPSSLPLSLSLTTPETLHQTTTQQLSRRGRNGGGLPASVLDDNFQRSNDARAREMAFLAKPSPEDPLNQAFGDLSEAQKQLLQNLTSTIVDVGDQEEDDPDDGEPSEWQQNGRQFPLKDLDKVTHNALWQDALEKGRKLKDKLDKAIAQGKNRSPALEPAGKDYIVSVVTDYDAERMLPEMVAHLEKVGITGSDARSVSLIEIYSEGTPPGKNEDTQEPVLQAAIDERTGTVISMQAFKVRDGNPPDKRLPYSELLFQSYDVVMADESSTSSTADLPAVFRHHITNQETNNIMTLAHMRVPEAVKDIAVGRDGSPLPPTTGHGVWRPDPPSSTTNPSTPQNDVYLRLLSTPNVKSIVHMLSDHVEDIRNPYISEIHTFPAVEDRPNMSYEAIRWSHLIIKLGQAPSGLRGGTVETS